jgi:phage tail-like protein
VAERATGEARGEQGRRGRIEGLESPVPLLQRLPGVLQDGEFGERFVSAFDDGFAPIITTLDSLSAYVDPELAPSDFLDWLSGWVGVELDDAWSLDQRRRIVAGAALVHRRRGTRAGLMEALELALGAAVEADDSGGCTWSAKPGGELPGEAAPRVDLRLTVSDPDRVDTRRVESLVEAVKPAHVAYTYEVAAGIGSMRKG